MSPSSRTHGSWPRCRRLPERQRAAVVLHYYADRSVKEAARIMGTSPAAVGVHLFRARKRLRELLGDDL